MSVLDDARQIVTSNPGQCPVSDCRAILYAGGEHRRECPWPRRARVVAVIEAAEKVANEAYYYTPEGYRYGYQVVDDDDLKALVAALKGDESA